jgi:filamentous hemagglutinin
VPNGRCANGHRAFVAEAAEGAAIGTPYAVEVQSISAEAQAALSEVQGGASLFRTGQLGESMAGESQYWSLQSPLSPGYASQMGAPGVTPNFIMGGTLNPGASVITNEAAGLGVNAGGGIQVVVTPNGVQGLWFHMP